MPIEIKELIIRASVHDESAGSTKRVTSSDAPSKINKGQEERIISQCVEQILNILRVQNER